MRDMIGRGWRPMRLAWLFVGLALLGACAPSVISLGLDPQTASDGGPVDDGVVTLELNKRLIEYGAGLFKDVSTVVFEGRALLLGQVADGATRERASEVAASVSSIGEVINEIDVGEESGGVGSFLNDVMIEKSITDDFGVGDGIDAAHYRVRAVGGVVYVIGRASDREELRRALAVAGNTDHVKRVVSHIVVALPR